MINNVTLVGRLTKPVDLRATQTGKFVGSFTIAVNGIKEGDTSFINCVVWEKRAEVIANYTSKGSKIAVNGELKTRSFEGQDGKRVYITEVLVNNFELLDQVKENTVTIEKNSFSTNI